MKKYRASKLTVRQITNDECREFLNRYHKQGFIQAAVCFGLFDEDELLQVETFGVPRIEKQNGTIWHDWELLRECSKADCQIYGGKSKLLKAFEKECHPLCLLSYCNTTAGFDGHSYAACGFTLEHTVIDYWYEYNGQKIQRYRMQKNSNMRKAGKKEPIQKTLESFGKSYDPNLSEKENAQNAGFILVQGKGQQTWTKRYSNFLGYIYDFELEGKHYIGQHTLYKDLEQKEPNETNYKGSGVYWNRVVKKYGSRAINKKVLKWYSSEYVMKKMEMKYIQKYEKEIGRENMYNLNFSIDATSHLWDMDPDKKLKANEKISKSLKQHYIDNPVSDETRQKLSESAKGKIISEEQRQKISESCKVALSKPEAKQKMSKAHKGKPHPVSDETRQKIAETLKQHYIDNPVSDETRQKLSKAARGKPHILTEAGKKAVAEANTKYKLGTTLSDETKKKCRESTTNLWKNEEYRAKTTKAIKESAKCLCKKVKDLETGITYDSIKECLEATGIAPTTFKRWRASGKRFVMIE